MDQAITLTLRFVHIVGGVFWVGAVFLNVFFLFPTVRDAGPQGGRIMQDLMQRRRLPAYINAAAGLTMLSGLIMYGRLAAASNGAWAGTPSGITFGIGGLATIIAAIIGGATIRRAGDRMIAIGATVQAAGGPPSDAQATEMRNLQARMARAMRTVAALLFIAVSAMAVGRYVG
jgi:hypothetical protein